MFEKNKTLVIPLIFNSADMCVRERNEKYWQSSQWVNKFAWINTINSIISCSTPKGKGDQK